MYFSYIFASWSIHSRVERSNGAESVGGQNLADQNNFVYRKARFSPDKSKQFFKCVKCDFLKCKAIIIH